MKVYQRGPKNLKKVQKFNKLVNTLDGFLNQSKSQNEESLDNKNKFDKLSETEAGLAKSKSQNQADNSIGSNAIIKSIQNKMKARLIP